MNPQKMGRSTINITQKEYAVIALDLYNRWTITHIHHWSKARKVLHVKHQRKSYARHRRSWTILLKLDSRLKTTTDKTEEKQMTEENIRFPVPITILDLLSTYSRQNIRNLPKVLSQQASKNLVNRANISTRMHQWFSPLSTDLSMATVKSENSGRVIAGFHQSIQAPMMLVVPESPTNWCPESNHMTRINMSSTLVVITRESTRTGKDSSQIRRPVS